MLVHSENPDIPHVVVTASIHTPRNIYSKVPNSNQSVYVYEMFVDVKQMDLHSLWKKLGLLELATPNLGQLTDMITCPGLDYCNLANARSIPVAQDINKHFVDVDRLVAIGDFTVNISGCMNACGHHHVGNVGILGVDKHGLEFFQLTLGGVIG